MEDKRIETAQCLLRQAAGTASVEEADAALLKAYRLLAALLNEREQPGGTARRHERRLLTDRRRPAAASTRPADAGAGRAPAGWILRGGEPVLDLRC